MLFWWICGGESVLPVLLLRHLGSSSPLPFLKASLIYSFTALFLKYFRSFCSAGTWSIWYPFCPQIHPIYCCQINFPKVSFLFCSSSALLLLFSHQVLFDFEQHTRLPCPSPSPGVCPSSCPLGQWCHPAISFCVSLFFCFQSLAASGSVPARQLDASGVQSIGASASASVLPVNTQDWSPFGWIGWISLQSKGLSRVFSNTAVQKHQFFRAQPSSWSSFHICTRLLERLKVKVLVAQLGLTLCGPPDSCIHGISRQEC